jgi:uncharacterized protein (TIGR03000 family)
MYSILLATVLATGPATPAADIYEDIRDLKKSVAELRVEQNEARIAELKLIIAGLREKITDEKLDEIRRDVRLLQQRGVVYGAVPLPLRSLRGAPTGTRATIAVEVPAGATFIVDKKEIPVPAVNPTFVTPPLEPGKDYFYDCKVTVERDGKSVTKVKRVKVHAGEVIRLVYDEMESP